MILILPSQALCLFSEYCSMIILHTEQDPSQRQTRDYVLGSSTQVHPSIFGTMDLLIFISHWFCFQVFCETASRGKFLLEARHVQGSLDLIDKYWRIALCRFIHGRGIYRIVKRIKELLEPRYQQVVLSIRSCLQSQEPYKTGYHRKFWPFCREGYKLKIRNQSVWQLFLSHLEECFLVWYHDVLLVSHGNSL